MWVLTTVGLFSTVRKPGDDHLTVRARSAGDLDRLRDRYLPGLGPTVEGAGTDYRFRALADPEEFAGAMAAVARDIDYANFKSEVNPSYGTPEEPRLRQGLAGGPSPGLGVGDKDVVHRSS